MSKHSAAEKYVQRGWLVVALHHLTPEGVCTCEKGAACRSAGKHPLKTSWQEGEPLSAADLYDHYQEGDANVGLATGGRSGFWVLDVDPDHDGDATLEALLREHGPLPTTYTVRTGSGGTHYYFTLGSEEVQSTVGRLGRGLDTRGEGGQVVAPPSVSDKGSYELVTDAELAEAPEWLVTALRPAEVVPLSDVEPPKDPDAWLAALLAGTASDLGALASADEGWDLGTFRVAVRLAEVAKSEWNPLTAEQARAHLHAHAPLQLSPSAQYPVPWTDADVEAKWRSGWNKAAPVEPPAALGEGFFIPFNEAGASWPTREWDDLGNALRLQDRYQDVLRWVPADREWAVYTEGRWKRLASDESWVLVSAMVASLEETEAMSYDPTPDDKGVSERGKFLKWAAKQRSVPAMKRALEAAQAVRSMKAHPDEFDADPFLFNALNGTVDLRTGELRPHRAGDLLAHQAGVEYDPEATAPRWEAFLEETHPDAGVREFLAEVVGYTLTGSMREQVFFIHQGVGSNGKSVFLDVLHSLLGSYAQVMKRTTLLEKRQDGMPTDVARMVGKRLLTVSETSVGRRLDEETIKGITGGDVQVGEHKYGREFEFRPQGKMHYMTNHLPTLSEADSIWRRVILLTWGRTFGEGEGQAPMDLDLTEKLKGELAGILAWAVRGAVAWRDRGRLEVPVVCRMEKQAYREENDELGAFITEALASAPGRVTPVAEVYDSYVAWADVNGIEHKLKKAWLSRQLSERGLDLDRETVDGKRVRVLKEYITREVVRRTYGDVSFHG